MLGNAHVKHAWAMASLRQVGAGRAAESCPSQGSAGEAAVAQRAPVEHQAGTGWPAFHGAAYVDLELMKCCRFHELQIDHVIGFGKVLQSTLRNAAIARARGYYEELLRGGRSARSAIAENSGSDENRHKTSD